MDYRPVTPDPDNTAQNLMVLSDFYGGFDVNKKPEAAELLRIPTQSEH